MKNAKHIVLRRALGIAAIAALCAGMASALAPTSSAKFRISDALLSGTRAPEPTGASVSARHVRIGVAVPRLVVTQTTTAVDDWQAFGK